MTRSLRAARAPAPRRLRRRDDAASEVIGYIMVFFLSSAVLILSLQAFLFSKRTTEDLRAGTELRIIGERLAQEVQQAAFVASDMPGARYEARVELPELAGRAYYVEAAGDRIHANTTDGMVHAESATFNVEALGSLTFSGRVYGSQGYAKVVYERAPSGSRTITLGV